MANINIESMSGFLLGKKYWILMNWFHLKDDVLISVIGCQIRRGVKLRRPGNCPVSSIVFQKSFVFNWLGKFFLSSLVNLQMAFVWLCRGWRLLSQAGLLKSPANTWGGSAEHVPPPGETTAEKQMRLRESRHTTFSNVLVSPLARRF